MEESLNLIQDQGGERLELVFSLRGSHSRSRSLALVALNGSASVSDPLELPTAATSSSNIENTLEPRPGLRKTHFVSTTMASDDYTVALKTTLASARGGTAGFFAGSLTNDDATNPPRPVQEGGRPLRERM